MFADDRELAEGADTPEGPATIQRELDRLEVWTDGNLTKLKEKCKVLHPRWNIPMYQYMLDIHLASVRNEQLVKHMKGN